jgi:hypothetical protein
MWFYPLRAGSVAGRGWLGGNELVGQPRDPRRWNRSFVKIGGDLLELLGVIKSGERSHNLGRLSWPDVRRDESVHNPGHPLRWDRMPACDMLFKLRELSFGA